jgi:hypothetical protein
LDLDKMGAVLSRETKAGPSKRNELTGRFIEALAKDWQIFGDEVIERVRTESPVKYAELVARLVPIESKVQVEQTSPELEGMGLPELKVFMIGQMQELFGVRLIESAAPTEDKASAT